MRVNTDTALRLRTELLPVAKSAHLAMLALLVRIARGGKSKRRPENGSQRFSCTSRTCTASTLDPREGEEFTPGQKFNGRDPTQRELSWEPGTLAMAKVPAGVYQSKDAERSEPVVYLACLTSDADEHGPPLELEPKESNDPGN